VLFYSFGVALDLLHDDFNLTYDTFSTSHTYHHELWPTGIVMTMVT